MPVSGYRPCCFMAGNIADIPLLPGGEACCIKGTVPYKRTGKRLQKGSAPHVSMRDFSIPHGNIGFVTDSMPESVIGHTALLKAVPNRPVFHP